MIFRKILLVFLAGAISVFAQNTAALRVGMELTYPPFEMIDKGGKPAGISVEIAESLGNYLGKKVLIENIPFVGLIPSLKNGKIDLIFSSMTITEERKQSIDFSDPYLKIGLALLVAKQASINNIQDADQNDRVIVVKQGTTGQVYAEKNLKKARVLILDKESSCVLEVVQGKADAFIYDQFSVYTNWQKNLGTTRAILQPFAIEYWGIGMRKGDETLRAQVNDFLEDFRKNKGFEKLSDRYLKEQKTAFKQLGIPFYF
jgi:polar amino acid transport system substrate-binding protein